MTTIPDDMNELTDVSIDRVDLVGKAANGHRFILAKSATDGPNLLSPETVRDLIKEADAEPAIAALVAFEGITAVLKAGRALSSANEAALRNASAAIQKVLESLPAPEEAPVEKETPVAEDPAAATVIIDAPILKTATVGEAPTEAIIADVPVLEVAKGEEPGAVEEVEKAGTLMAVYDSKGKLVGVIKPNALTAVEGAGSDDAAPADEAPKEEAPEEPFEEAAADEIQPEDGAPAEALGDDEELIPGTETVQSPVEKTEADANVTQAPDVAALLKELLAPLAEKIASVADLASTVEVLKERVEAYGREPDDRKSPLLNGADGKAGIAKRSAESDNLVDLTKAVEIAKEAGDPSKLVNAQQALAFAAIKDRFSGNS